MEILCCDFSDFSLICSWSWLTERCRTYMYSVKQFAKTAQHSLKPSMYLIYYLMNYKRKKCLRQNSMIRSGWALSLLLTFLTQGLVQLQRFAGDICIFALQFLHHAVTSTMAGSNVCTLDDIKGVFYTDIVQWRFVRSASFLYQLLDVTALEDFISTHFIQHTNLHIVTRHYGKLFHIAEMEQKIFEGPISIFSMFKITWQTDIQGRIKALRGPRPKYFAGPNYTYNTVNHPSSNHPSNSKI